MQSIKHKLLEVVPEASGVLRMPPRGAWGNYYPESVRAEDAAYFVAELSTSDKHDERGRKPLTSFAVEPHYAFDRRSASKAERGQAARKEVRRKAPGAPACWDSSISSGVSLNSGTRAVGFQESHSKVKA